MTRSLRLLVAGVVALSLFVSAAPSLLGSTSGAAVSSPSVVRWAEPIGSPPNFIFPFMTLQSYSVSNINTFQYLMYRPLYWFGSRGTPDLNRGLSLAAAPRYGAHNTTVTIDLKPGHWSNGEQVSSRDVLFWMNLLHADKEWWAAYLPGSIPDDVTSITIPSATRVVLTLASSVNPSWFTANQLSQLTPLPVAWDRTASLQAPGAGGCSLAPYGTADASCNAVFTFLSRQAGFDPANPTQPNAALSSYATNPLWQVVDGPWRLTTFTPTGAATFVPNPTYAGPATATLHSFVEVPFSSASAEFNALVARQVDVGYLPFQDITKSSSDPIAPKQANARLSGYQLQPLYSWSINYFPYNFGSTTDFGIPAKIFAQQYFRQAVQSLVNQQAYAARVYKGFAVPTNGPVPSSPRSSATRSLGRANPYPYDPGHARSLLSSHGWKIAPGRTSVCVAPGTATNQCGAGIPRGSKLDFTLEYASDIPLLGQLMNAEQASWAQVGIAIHLTSAPSSQVLATTVPCVAGQSCNWELATWGVGWLFESSSYPSGEPIFATGAGSNAGGYSSPATDASIRATMQTAGSLDRYVSRVATDLPVVFQPNPAASLTEIRSDLHGVSPQNPLFSITPEAWRY